MRGRAPAGAEARSQAALARDTRVAVGKRPTSRASLQSVKALAGRARSLRARWRGPDRRSRPSGPVGDGAWSWFGDPRAVTHDGRTYVRLGRPAGRYQGQLLRPRHRRAGDRGPPGAPQPGRSREPVGAGPARRSSRRLLLAARRPDDALPRVLAARGRHVLGRAANRAHEHARASADTRTRTRSGWRTSPPRTCSGAAATTTRRSRSRTTARQLVAGANADHDAGRAPVREVRLERRRHDPRGLHERPPERVRRT